VQDLEFVRHLARATAVTTDLDRVLHLALDVVCDHLEADVGTVWRPDNRRGWRLGHRYPTGIDGGLRDTATASELPPVMASMLATGTPSSLWRDTQGHSVAAAIVGEPQRPVAVLQISLARTVSAQPVLALCETAAELLTRVVERASSEAQLLEAQRLARMGSWQWDLVADEVVWSDQLFANLGIDPGALEPSRTGFLEIVHPADRDVIAQAAVRALADLEPFEVTFRTSASHTGQQRWVRARGRAVAGPDGRPVRVAGTAQDVTERVELEQELAYRATHDVLTGLANRSAFQERLEELLTARGAGSVAVAVVNIDRFGPVTTQLGHGAGDLLLGGIAERLVVDAPPDAVVARLVGDEFAVAVVEGRSGPELADDLGARLLAAFDAPFEVGDGLQALTASVGVVHTATGAETADDLLRDTALALELAKTRGGGRVQVFDQEQHAQALEQLALEADLRQAVDQGDLRVVYQPVVEMSSGAMVATEALVRWDRPGHGAVSPGEFVPLAERLGLAGRLGSQVLLTACSQLVAWHREFPDAGDFSIAVNLSAVQLDDANVVAMVEEALQRSGLAPEQLTLEVTESALPDDAAGALTRLWDLRRLGVRIAIDDFGTGYSTLSRLRELPVDVLKIDRSFLADTSRDAPILQALFAMARTLELGTVTEGVETPAQLAAVLANHGDLVQGYLFARPLAPQGIARLLRDPDWDTDVLTTAEDDVAIVDYPQRSHIDELVDDLLAVVDRDDLDRPLRDLLAAVAGVTGMDSVYLTRIDLPGQRQDIDTAVNAGSLEVTEGTSLAWSDTLCRRALLDDRKVVEDVPAEYPEVVAARDLGIATFMVAPVRTASGGLRGTLCAAAAQHQEVSDASVELLTHVAALVAERLAALEPAASSPTGHST